MQKSLDKIKVNFTGVTTGKRTIKYFDIYSLTKDRATIILGDMKNLTINQD